MNHTAVRTLRSQDSIVARRQMLSLPHIVPLSAFCSRLRVEGRGVVPDFDPLDGGVDAEILFLMEKPGPMTDDTNAIGRTGSGFISRDNDDPTAEAILKFMESAKIARERSILWNIIPWWNGTRKISAAEHEAGSQGLAGLMDILPNLRVVVGVGARARKAERMVAQKGLPFVLSAHPSPINRASRPDLWAAIPSQWAHVHLYLEG